MRPSILSIAPLLITVTLSLCRRHHVAGAFVSSRNGITTTSAQRILQDSRPRIATTAQAPTSTSTSTRRLSRISMSADESVSQTSPPSQPSPSATPPCIHHVAIKTRNITNAMSFYGLLGFEETTRFRAGPAKAAWLELSGSAACRLELIEVPPFLLPDNARAVNLMQRQELLGQNHFAMDVTQSIAQDASLSNLQDYIASINRKSIETFGKALRIALQPQQQMIGNGVFELAFLFDADGSLIELLNKQSELEQTIASGWEPWMD